MYGSEESSAAGVQYLRCLALDWECFVRATVGGAAREAVAQGTARGLAEGGATASAVARAYAVAIAVYGCPAIQPTLASMHLSASNPVSV